jgi:cytochrome c-type biogenesis protein CcmF
MPQLGSYALLLALALSAYSLVGGALALLPGAATSSRLGETARRAGIAVWIALTVAAVALVVAAFTNDFSVAYIAHHSNIALPAAYKFAVLWSGQEGSLLFWAWLLSTYGLVLRLRHNTDQRLFAHASAILAGIQLFFILLLNFAAHPFAMTAGAVPPDGAGLNPTLQYPEMVIHPPMLYLGYVGFSVPFAFALGALIMRYPGEKWIHITRRWTMVGWGFLSAGIVLGMHWAYGVLGWGGYWGWDPVENASFLPWLTGTAFLHSVMMQEKRGMLKVWNVWLIFITFLLSIFGTLLTRAGLVSSVHAFAQSSIGTWFVGFMIVIGVVCLFFFIKNADHLKSEHRLESLVSRESSFLFNNVVLLALCFTILWGTLFPVLSEWVQGHKVTVGAPFYNRVAVPLAMVLLLLTAVGPLLAWRKASVESLKRNFLIPTFIAVGTMIAVMALGVQPWNDVADFYSLLTWGLSALVLATIAMEFMRGGRVIAGHTGQNLFGAMVTLTRRNTRRYGGYVVHVGMVLILVGVAGSTFNRDNEQEMAMGDKMQIGRYTLVCNSYTEEQTPNDFRESAILDVYQGTEKLTTLYPERRVYLVSSQPATMVGIRSTLREDLYVIFTGLNEQTGRPIIKAQVHPLINWIWIGAFVFIGGTLLALVPNLEASKVKRKVEVPARAGTTTHVAAEAGD